MGSKGVVAFNGKEAEYLDIFRIKKSKHGTRVGAVRRCPKQTVPTPAIPKTDPSLAKD